LIPARDRDIFSLQPHPHWFWSPTEVFSPEVKWPGHEADHSPPTDAKVKKAWCYISTPSYVLTALCLIKLRIHPHGMMFS